MTQKFLVANSICQHLPCGCESVCMCVWMRSNGHPFGFVSVESVQCDHFLYAFGSFLTPVEVKLNWCPALSPDVWGAMVWLCAVTRRFKRSAGSRQHKHWGHTEFRLFLPHATTNGHQQTSSPQIRLSFSKTAFKIMLIIEMKENLRHFRLLSKLFD